MGRRGTARTSCDSCFAKKVKCDLRSRQEQAAATSPGQAPSCCSYCLRHGFACTLEGQDAASSSRDVDRAPSLLGISGLDRQTLDEAVQAYFSHDAICKPLAPPELFLPRYHASLDSSGEGSLEPASPILILAVAACGVAWLEHLGPRRFELQERIVEAITKLAADNDDDGTALDKIEAIALVWDLEACRKIVNRHREEALIVHPLSDEAIVRLVLRHGLHTSAPSAPLRTLRDIQGAASSSSASSGKPSSEGSSSQRSQHQASIDALRRTILFWMVYADDALLRFESGRLPLIHEDEVDAPMLPDEFGTPFYRDWISALLSLAVLLRAPSAHLCSARSKRLGLKPSHVLRFLSDLETWRRSLPISLVFADEEAEGSSPYDLVASTGAAGPVGWSEIIQRAFLELTFYGLHSSVHILAAQVGLEDVGDGSSTRARAEIDEHLIRSLDAIVWRSQRCAQLGFLDYSNLVLRTIPRGCAYYSLLLSDAALSQGLPTLAEHLLRQSDKLGAAISTLTAHPDARAEAEELGVWQALRGARLGAEGVSQEALADETKRFDGRAVIASSREATVSDDAAPDRARPFAFDASLFTDPAAYFERILEEPVA